jgi:2-hydroxychromene-2-carboxylate isomerase
MAEVISLEHHRRKRREEDERRQFPDHEGGRPGNGELTRLDADGPGWLTAEDGAEGPVWLSGEGPEWSAGEGPVVDVPPAAGPRPRPVSFYFDLASPFTYLAVERVHRLLPWARWEPVSAGPELESRDPWTDPLLRAAVEQRASTLGAPLIWPERPLDGARAAMRASAFAASRGRAQAFVLAAERLAFCGGFDLDDPELLAEASASAGLPFEGCLAAVLDERRDHELEQAGRRLVEAGADQLPALAVEGTLFAGEERLPEAVAAATAPRPARRIPFAG